MFGQFCFISHIDGKNRNWGNRELRSHGIFFAGKINRKRKVKTSLAKFITFAGFSPGFLTQCYLAYLGDRPVNCQIVQHYPPHHPVVDRWADNPHNPWGSDRHPLQNPADSSGVLQPDEVFGVLTDPLVWDSP